MIEQEFLRFSAKELEVLGDRIEDCVRRLNHDRLDPDARHPRRPDDRSNPQLNRNTSVWYGRREREFTPAPI